MGSKSSKARFTTQSGPWKGDYEATLKPTDAMQSVPSQEDYEATLKPTDVVFIYLSLIRKLPGDFDLHLFLIIQSYAGLSFTLTSSNNCLHRGEEFENVLYHHLKRKIPTKRNFIPKSISVTTTSKDQGWCDMGYDGSRNGSYTYFQLQINRRNSCSNSIMKTYERVMVHRNIRAGRLFDTTTKVFQERKMDTKNYPWYLVNRKEGEEHVVENVKWDLKIEQLHYNPETLICINPSEDARLYSTVFDNDNIGTGHARSMLESKQAWSASVNNKEQWMIIDLGMQANVQGIVVSGRGRSCKDQSVTEVAVELSCDRSSWIKAGEYKCETFNEQDLKFVRLTLSNLKSSSNEYRYVKIRPLRWKKHISMRAGIVIKNVTLPILKLMLKQSKEVFQLFKERECPVHMLKSIFEAGGEEKEQDDFEVQLYSRSNFPGWRNTVRNAKINVSFEPDMYKIIAHPLGLKTDDAADNSF